MNTIALSQLEDRIDRLSLDEQLWLVERLIHRIRENREAVKPSMDAQLAAMADDPDIQRELNQIEFEFAFVETDGLDDL